MLTWKMVLHLACCQVLGLGAPGFAQTPDPPRSSTPSQPIQVAEASPSPAGGADALLASIRSPSLRSLVAEALERNPGIARARRLAAAAAARAPQARALPDPTAALSLFVLPVETRAGAQRLSASVQQRLPWFGKLALREQVALYAAAAARAEVETVRLDTLNEARRLGHELAFLDAYERIVKTERGSLVRYEKAAQGRYAAGIGAQQEIVRIQAQITRVDTRLLEILERRAHLQADLNRLRDRPADTPIGVLDPNDPAEPRFDRSALRTAALVHRPEVAAADAKIAAGTTRSAIANKAFRPDITLGLSYTAVERRDDAAARADRPADDGDDIFALTGALNLPVRKRRLEAGLQEAQALRWAAEEEKRAVLAEIEGAIGDLVARMPLLAQHLSLLEDVLYKQAREALRSAETAYSTGKLNAVDLLDAEVVLFEVQIAAARTRADLALAWSKLERTVGRPIENHHDEPYP